MKRILTLGDSIAAGYVDGVGDGGWVDIIGIDPSLQRAVSGSTAAQWAQTEWLHRALASVNFDVVVMSILGNDYREAVQDGALSFEEIVNGMTSARQVVNAVACTGRQTIFLKMCDPWFGQMTPAREFIEVLRVSQSCICYGLPVQVLDMAAVLGPSDFPGGTGFHPNAEGQKKLAARIRELIA